MMKNKFLRLFVRNLILEKIVQEDGKWCVKSEDGLKNLGCFETKEKAVKRLKQVEYFKTHEHLEKELLLRKNIREAVREFVKKQLNEEEMQNPGENTGINSLKTIAKQIIPIIGDNFKSLTSNDEQRQSFKNHLLHAFLNMFDRIDDQQLFEQKLPDDFVEVEEQPKKQNPDEDSPGEQEDDFNLEGEDRTGANYAFKAFKGVQKQIESAYGILENQEDREVFKRGFFSNLKAYFERWEGELAGSLKEPDVPTL